MLALLIGIIVVVGACYLGFVFYQRRTIKMATDVYENKRDLNKIPLDDEFTLAKKLNLTGESQKKYDELLKKYQHYTDQLLPGIEQKIATVKQDGKGINFIKTKNDWQSANQAIQDADSTIKGIQAALAQLYDLNKQHHLAVDELEKKYKRLREDMLNQNESFGPSIDALEKLLADIEGTFDEFTELTKSGDPNSAEEVLTDLNRSTSELESDMASIPKLYHVLSKEFIDQLDEIKTGYQEMMAKHYNFPNDSFMETIETLREEIKNNVDKLAALNVESVQKTNDQIAGAIDHLYDALEDELKARPDVEANTKMVDEYIDHVRRQNSDLALRLENLNKGYVLNHKEIENNHQYDQQISTIEKQFDNQTQEIKTGKAVYSVIDDEQQAMVKNLGQIETLQKQLFQTIIQLPQKEQEARQSLAKFDLEMRNKKRRIDNHNLPGLPDDYQDDFASVVREINHLNDAMSKPQIDIDDISKQVIIIQSDMDTLNDRTEKLIDNAALAEETMQYANRFINLDPEIAEASEKARIYFDHQYDYQKSLDTISIALEKQSSGVIDKIREDYFNAKKVTRPRQDDQKSSTK
ncbi:MAG: septation ring formation regulator EzrA [Lentilactobacillus diolivorans]|jgi:septation ring formation regulator|uniref:Septation ring formation regulator EzrA n=2 Tax=Lentilactobacillus diolivorans TaxID=179838 RepID=A0A0R1SJP7_9LACO|nr:septation ring formation regulator EzrA [Lentilactobacillus diolivorans]KRL69001.1 septation ring formation regulator EzrA [Lentilactobacillus diolivorans DSM 14421]MCH4163428.1 septation ring formation regulator EzrA [Lentilactobacillus diolivorans]RRG04492.1 MAG: septation ring formation regulator EzrA [Lactobacillus sp.]GEP22552.1 septation ring formation regulator EzrA [Lentilactobacillus diolivorans]